MNDHFSDVFTKFILFELENSKNSVPNDEIYKLDILIKFHEKKENYEICERILKYKNICLNSSTKSK